MKKNINKSMKKGGKLAILENLYCHGPACRLDKEHLIKLMAKENFTLDKDLDILAHTHFVVFRK